MDMSRRSSRLCEKCAAIDLIRARRESFPHHSCFGAIRRSAANGCDLCKLIVDATYFRMESDSYQEGWEDKETEDTRIICEFYSSSDLIGEKSMFSENVAHSRLDFREIS
jgi:hypothetical protein